MRPSTRVFSLSLSLALVLSFILTILLPHPALAALRKRVESPTVTLRAAPGSWIIGTAFGSKGPRRPWTIDVQQDAVRGYRSGFVYGNFQFCAWIRETAMSAGGGDTSSRCSASDLSMTPSRFMTTYGTNRPPTVGDDGGPATINHNAPGCAGQIGAFANVRPWLIPAQPHDFLFNTKHLHPVKWRYITRDGQWVLVRDPSLTIGSYPPNWYFVKIQCINLESTGYPPPS